MRAPVARVGDTVRRAAGPWTDAIHDLLRHVRANGVTWVPEPRGRDAQGLAGAIDFDAASPGPRVWDLAHLAYRLVPLTAPTNPDVPPAPEHTRAARLSRLCEAYGGQTPQDVLTTIPARLDELAALGRHAEIYRADAEYLRSS